MVRTPSNMLPLGTKATDFRLYDTVSQKELSLADLRAPKATVIAFICNHCPFVIHIREQLIAVARQYQNQDIQFIAISANDAGQYPQDGPEAMHELALQYDLPFPYLYDETQAVAKAYAAACTPDFYIFDGDLSCVYRGQFDDSRPGNEIAVTGESLTQALDALLQQQPIDFEQKPSIGCNIKWR